MGFNPALPPELSWLPVNLLVKSEGNYIIEVGYSANVGRPDPQRDVFEVNGSIAQARQIIVQKVYPAIRKTFAKQIAEAATKVFESDSSEVVKEEEPLKPVEDIFAAIKPVPEEIENLAPVGPPVREVHNGNVSEEVGSGAKNQKTRAGGKRGKAKTADGAE